MHLLLVGHGRADPLPLRPARAHAAPCSRRAGPSASAAVTQESATVRSSRLEPAGRGRPGPCCAPASSSPSAPGGAVRSYSLSRAPGGGRYRISVKREPGGAIGTCTTASGSATRSRPARPRAGSSSTRGRRAGRAGQRGHRRHAGAGDARRAGRGRRGRGPVAARRPPRLRARVPREARARLGRLPAAGHVATAAPTRGPGRTPRAGSPRDRARARRPARRRIPPLRRAGLRRRPDRRSARARAPARVTSETFGGLPPRRARRPGGRGRRPEVAFARSDVRTTWDESFSSLLDLAEARAVPNEASCRVGSCHGCRATVSPARCTTTRAGRSAARGSVLLSARAPRATSCSMPRRPRGRCRRGRVGGDDLGRERAQGGEALGRPQRERVRVASASEWMRRTRGDGR